MDRKGRMYPVVADVGSGERAVAPGVVDPAGGGYVQPPDYIVDDRPKYVYPSAPPGYGYAGQQQQVSYGPGYGPGYGVHDPEYRRRRNGFANAIAALFVACWCITWPCHGPCCCGL